MSEIKSIEAFIETYLPTKWASEYSRLEAKILNSFFKRLVDAGFTLVSVFDGEDNHVISENNRFQALDAIFAVDNSTSVTIKSNTDEVAHLILALGNEDATTIADHSQLSSELEKFIFDTWAQCVKTHSMELYDLNWAA